MITWHERVVIRILLLVAKIAGKGLSDEIRKEIETLQFHINVGIGERP